MLALVLMGCPETALLEEAPAPWTDAEREAAITAGSQVLQRHECRRCHEIDDLPDPARPLHCTGCHVFLTGLTPDDRRYASIAEKTGEDVLLRYQRNIVHLGGHVPSLSELGRRVDPVWIGEFLEAPTDLRPVLAESMIRTTLTEDERRALVRYFAAVAGREDPFAAGAVPPKAPEPASPSRIAEGEDLFKAKACGTCHTMGNRETGMKRETLENAYALTALAPNLRFVRERMDHATTVAWIVDPKGVWPPATMPAMGVSAEEAAAITDFLFFADPEIGPMPGLPDLPSVQLLDRPVAYEEVKDQVLGKVCVHCHMNEHEKDPGPGNTGGLGYDGLGVQMRTYETLVGGARGVSFLEARGQPHSALVRSLLLRRQEALRDQVPAFADVERPAYPVGLGMPLGLPSMTDHEISLVATWISQGCPGPQEVSGRAGFDDGFLVPDGPIADNAGCDARPRAATRPDWAVDAP